MAEPRFPVRQQVRRASQRHQQRIHLASQLAITRARVTQETIPLRSHQARGSVQQLLNFRDLL
jgi:shikimate kinase